MRKIVLLSLLLVNVSCMNSQVVFCPPGAQWNYLLYTSWVAPYESNESITYVRDSVINFETLKVLRHTHFFTSCSPYVPVTLLKQKGDTIFIRNQRTDNKWEILYNFAANKGDSWQTTVRQSNNNLATFTYLIDSVDYVLYNGFTLKRLILAGTGAIEYRQIVERIGFNYFLFNYMNSNINTCHSWGVYGGLCYRDNNFGIKKLTEKPCDYATAIHEFNNEHRINFYPNPFSGELIIENVAFVLNSTEIRFQDITGREVRREVIRSNSIETTYLLPGLYFVTVFQNDVAVYQTKLVKE